MKSKSCLTNLLEYLEVLTKLVDEGHSVDVVYLDFAKAFDKVPHQRLLMKMKAHGIDGKVVEWVGAWLSDRKQRVVLNGKKSNWEKVESGVPQGSVMGPTCFIIYINDIDTAVDTITAIISKFADDTKVGRVVESDNDREKLQMDLDRLGEWSEDWQMLFNSGKCKVIHFGRRNNEYTYTMGGYAPAGSVLESVVEEKDVGVIIHNSLKPSAQCAKAAKKANQVLGQMARAFHYRDRVTWVRLYKTYVRCHLEYSVQAWCPWTQKDKDVLEMVQKRAVRMISGLQGKEYVDRLKEVGLTTLEARRDRGDLIEVWGILHGKKDVDPTTWFRMASEGAHRTRLAGHPLSIFKERSNLEIRRNFFSMRCCDKWNRLPNNIKEAKSLNVFKNEYDKYLELLDK
jgi:hypothetical protein